MKDQVLNVWADLRDRQLWPVAALLLLCLVAVPVVLVKPAEEAPSHAATPTTATNASDPLAKQAVVQAFDAKPLVKVSNLDQFAAKDPFKPTELLKPLSASNVTATTGNGAGAQPGSSGSSGGGGVGGPAGGGVPPAGGAPSGGTGGGTAPSAPTTKKYTYVVDLTFRHGHESRRYQSFDRLGMLPSETSPLLVYLGVDASGTQAAFLVDSTLAAAGEGTCKPSPGNCGVVYLEPGEKETFTDGQGGSYELVIDQVRKVVVGSKSASAKARGASTADESARQPRRFLFPVLIDLETGGHS